VELFLCHSDQQCHFRTVNVRLFSYFCRRYQLFFRSTENDSGVCRASITLSGGYLSSASSGTSKSQRFECGSHWSVFSTEFALLTVFNRQYGQHINPERIAFWQNLYAGCWLLPLLFTYQIIPSLNDVVILALLGVVFTALAHTLSLFSLKTIPAFAVSIAVSLEPVYGIFAAYLLLNETMTVAIFAGGLLVLIASVWAGNTQAT